MVQRSSSDYCKHGIRERTDELALCKEVKEFIEHKFAFLDGSADLDLDSEERAQDNTAFGLKPIVRDERAARVVKNTTDPCPFSFKKNKARIASDHSAVLLLWQADRRPLVLMRSRAKIRHLVAESAGEKMTLNFEDEDRQHSDVFVSKIQRFVVVERGDSMSQTQTAEHRVIFLFSSRRWPARAAACCLET